MPLLSTVTHARLRAAQGDLGAARRILHELLAVDPGQTEAWELLAAWEGGVEIPAAAEGDTPPPPPAPARAEALAARFRSALAPERGSARTRTIARLSSWSDRLKRSGAR